MTSTTGAPVAGMKRDVVLAAPAAVPVSMALIFHGLSQRMSPRAAYNVGFIIYWLAWCMGFPLLVLGPRRAAGVIAKGRRPSVVETLLLIAPVTGAVGAELLPNRSKINKKVAAVMAITGVVNATGEELPWRGVFLEEFRHERLRGMVWPLAEFSLWHLAPQMILPARIGRWRFVLGAAWVGSVSTFSAWRSGGLRNCLISHIATDSCGQTAARFRLGRT